MLCVVFRGSLGVVVRASRNSVSMELVVWCDHWVWSSRSHRCDLERSSGCGPAEVLGVV